MINTVTLIGNICHDLELRKTQSGKSVLSFTVASNNGKGKDGNDLPADFIPCQAWEKTAEIIGQYCHKGSKVGISGQIKSYTKTDDQNKNRTFIFIRVERIMLLDAKPASQPVQPQTQPVYQPQEAPAPAQATYQPGYNPSYDDIPSEDLPF